MSMFPEIADEIVRMAKEEQRMRRASMAGRDKWDFSVDERNTARMRSIIAKIGWPTRSKVGRLAEHRAWLLAQHAVADREFQRHCLALMKDMPQNEVCASHIAHLEDRVRLARGSPAALWDSAEVRGGRHPRAQRDRGSGAFR